MMHTVQSAAVIAANVVLPGSGVIVNSVFELSKIIFEIAQVLSGMEGKASTIKSQQENIKEDVEEFQWVLKLMKRVNHQTELTDGLQKLITKFEAEVKTYDRIVDKFLRKYSLKQLVFHKDLDNASANVKKTKAKLIESLIAECSIDGSITYRREAPAEEREKRCMAFLNSPEVIAAMNNPDNQKKILSAIDRMDRSNGMMMQNSLDTKDPVVSAMKEKLLASSSRSTQDAISNVPDWYMTEDEVDIDVHDHRDGTPVAVKIFSENVAKSDAAKEKFFSTMKLWDRLIRYEQHLPSLWWAAISQQRSSL